MVELKVNEFRRHLTGNITNLGLTTILVDNDESEVLVCFKNPNADIKQRLIMDRITKMRKVRILLEPGDFVRLRKRKAVPPGSVPMYEETTYIAHNLGKVGSGDTKKNRSIYLNQIRPDATQNLRFTVIDPNVSLVSKTYIDIQNALLGKDSVCTVRTRAGMCTINFTELTHLFEFSRQIWSSNLCYGYNIVDGELIVTPLTHRLMDKLVKEQDHQTYCGLITISLTSNAIGFHYFWEIDDEVIEKLVRNKINTAGLMMETSSDDRTVYSGTPYFVSRYPDPTLLHIV